MLLPTLALRSYFAPEAPYRATAPTGTGTVRAFVSSRPLRLPTPPGTGPGPAYLLLDALLEAAAGGEWSAATLSYRVMP